MLKLSALFKKSLLNFQEDFYAKMQWYNANSRRTSKNVQELGQKVEANAL